MSRVGIQTLINGISDGGNNTAAEIRQLLVMIKNELPSTVNAVVTPGQNVNATVVASLSSGGKDDEWAVNANNIVYTGTPRYILLMATVEVKVSGTSQRVQPRMTLRRNGVLDLGSVHGYIRNTAGTNLSNSLTLCLVDYAPGQNPSYDLIFSVAGVTGVSAVTLGNISAEAVGN